MKLPASLRPASMLEAGASDFATRFFTVQRNGVEEETSAVQRNGVERRPMLQDRTLEVLASLTPVSYTHLTLQTIYSV